MIIIAGGPMHPGEILVTVLIGFAVVGSVGYVFAVYNGLVALENQIADRREFYNDTVTTFNTRIHQIPHLYVANWMSLRPGDLFAADETDRRDVEIKFALAG